MSDTDRVTMTENGQLSDMQIERLLKGVGENRVAETRGMSYIPQHEVRAELTRVFGFGNWDTSVHSVELLYEEQRQGTGANKDKMYWFAGYRCAVTLRIRDYNGNPVCEFTEYHAEENAPQPNRGEAHALALTACESYALRRAAIGLGDRFGLSLYNFGATAPMVKGTLQQVERSTDPEPEVVPEPTTQVQDAEARVARAFSGATQEPEGGTDSGS
jgi:Rad52/22 family double-strand break repair protein